MIPVQFLSQTVSIRNYLGKTPTGVKYSEPFKVRCKFEHKKVRVKTAKGEEFTQSAEAYFNPDKQLQSLNIDSLLSVNIKDYVVKDIEIFEFEGTLSHIKVVLV